MRHKYKKHGNCELLSCMICDGGLAVCTVCGGAEAGLTTDCPGRPLTEDEEVAIRDHSLDFVDGLWVKPKERTAFQRWFVDNRIADFYGMDVNMAHVAFEAGWKAMQAQVTAVLPPVEDGGLDCHVINREGGIYSAVIHQRQHTCAVCGINPINPEDGEDTC